MTSARRERDEWKRRALTAEKELADYRAERWLRIHINGPEKGWKDGYHWTVFDALPDYRSSQVEGTLVPYAIAQKREPSRVKALERALMAATPAGVGTRQVVVPLAVATTAAITSSVEREARRQHCPRCGDSFPNPERTTSD